MKETFGMYGWTFMKFRRKRKREKESFIHKINSTDLDLVLTWPNLITNLFATLNIIVPHIEVNSSSPLSLSLIVCVSSDFSCSTILKEMSQSFNWRLFLLRSNLIHMFGWSKWIYFLFSCLKIVKKLRTTLCCQILHMFISLFLTQRKISYFELWNDNSESHPISSKMILTWMSKWKCEIFQQREKERAKKNEQIIL